MTARRLLPLFCLAAFLVATANVFAAAPPAGTYECRFWTDKRTYGLITIFGPSTYAWNRGARGRFTTSGRTIRFTTGPLRGVYRSAAWRNNGHSYWINLFDEREFGPRLHGRAVPAAAEMSRALRNHPDPATPVAARCRARSTGRSPARAGCCNPGR
jgi:hypothetical protein